MVLLAGISSCKLMPRNDPSEKDKKLSMNGPFVTPEWAKQTSIYEVNLRQYTVAGTFNAFAAELPRLKELGVETLWFMPLTPIAQKNKKGSLGSYYACSDYKSINPEFGTIEDFKQLVQQAHSMGFKVIIDPSHGSKRSEFVLPMARASLQLGLDGLMIECHPRPTESVSDAKQAISLEAAEEFIRTSLK